jgi:hypothetical protein
MRVEIQWTPRQTLTVPRLISELAVTFVAASDVQVLTSSQQQVP